MAATYEDISVWFNVGKSKGARHMVIMCDTFSYDDYPVYTETDEECLRVCGKSGTNMQRVMEVYDLSMEKKEQMDQHRVMNIPKES